MLGHKHECITMTKCKDHCEEHLSKGYMAKLSEWEHVHPEVCRDDANKSFCISQMILFTLVFKNALFPWLQMCWTLLEDLWSLTMRKPRVRPHFICSMRGVVGLPSTSVLLSRHARTAPTFSPFSLSITSSLSARYPPAYGVFFLHLSTWQERPTCGRVCWYVGAMVLLSFPFFLWSFWPREFGVQMGQIMQPWSERLGLVWFKC